MALESTFELNKNTFLIPFFEGDIWFNNGFNGKTYELTNFSEICREPWILRSKPQLGHHDLSLEEVQIMKKNHFVMDDVFVWAIVQAFSALAQDKTDYVQYMQSLQSLVLPEGYSWFNEDNLYYLAKEKTGDFTATLGWYRKDTNSFDVHYYHDKNNIYQMTLYTELEAQGVIIESAYNILNIEV